MKPIRLAPFLAAAALCVALPAAARAAEPTTLKFGFPASLDSDFARAVLAWNADVEKELQGALKLQMFPGTAVATFANVLDRVQNNVIDIGFGIFGPYSRQTPRTAVVELPFVVDNSKACSTALWRLNAQGLTASEYKSFHPLALFCFTTASLQSTRPVHTAADMQGLKIAASDKVMSDDLRLLGSAPITLNPGEFFEALNRGVVQGVLISWPGAKTFKLQDVAKYHLTTPFGLFPAFIAMNHRSYGKLAGTAKATIDKLSGEVLSQRLGVALDKANDATVGEFKALKGHEVSTLSAAEAARWKKILAPTTAEWVKHAPDGAKVLSAFEAEVKKVNSGS